MESVILDYEILIKLRKTGIKFMSAVPFVIYTTDYVMHEIRRFLPGDSLTTWINVVRVETINEEETPTMLDLMDKNISLSDCSVLFLAKRNNWELATESEPLKKKAYSMGGG